jgi:hypothetical protein
VVAHTKYQLSINGCTSAVYNFCYNSFTSLLLRDFL